MSLPAGQRLGGFQIIQQIGRGAMGTVYRAKQVALEREVALKVLDAHDPDALARFRKEAIRVGQLSHPNILPVYDFGQEEDTAFIAMALAGGGTLAARVGVPMSPEQAIRLLAPVAQALDYAHEANVIHRDVKPANILFDAQARIFLADFGLALLRDSTSASWGQMLGTPSHMAPEQLRSKAEPASDIYALAVTLFQLLTGHLPYERENPLAVALAHLKDPIPSAQALNPALSDDADRVLRRGLAKNPAARFVRAVDLLGAMKAALRGPGAPLPGRSGGTVAQAVRPMVGPRQSMPVQPFAAGGAAEAAARPGVTALAPSEVGPAAAGKPVPTLGRTIFESKSTLEWARGNIIMRSGRPALKGELIEVRLVSSNQAQMLLPVGVLQATWAELQFAVAPDSGVFDLLFHEAVLPQSHCVRVDPRQSQVSVGLVPARGSGEDRWLATRRVALEPETEHTLVLAASKQEIDVYLDGSGILSVNDATIAQGLVRLRMLPARDVPTSTLLLRRVAVYRPPQ